MFVRTKKVQYKGAEYLYAQLVESYRNKQGKPRQRVIASLGKLTELQVENLRIALQAAGDDEAVFRLQDSGESPVVAATLDYLPIAVVLETSRRLGLDQLLSSLLDESATSVPTSKVVQALVAHRLIAPGSKLAASRWFQRTATPQLLGADGKEFNNSRLHRALDALDAVRPRLQHAVADLFRAPTEAGRALFIDVSDTWFEGRGPTLARRHKTKEGMYRKKVGIVLTVNKQGYPLRWEVVQGGQNDGLSIKAMARQLGQIEWMRELPLVFDRAMGKPKHLQELLDAELRFVTFLTRESFARYAGEDLDLGLDSIEVNSDEDVQAQASAIELVQKAGFTALGRRLWVRDLGVRNRFHKPTSSRRKPERVTGRALRGAQAVRRAEELTERKETTGKRYQDIAEEAGISRGKMNHLRKLMKLAPQTREIVKQGRCFAPLDTLEELGNLDTDEQLTSIKQYCVASESATMDGSTGPQLRVFVAFDPEVFVRARASSVAVDQEIREQADRLELALLEGRTSLTKAAKKISKLLTRFAVNDCYDVRTTSDSIRVARRDDTWQHKRRCDGIRLMVMHPDLDLSAQEALDLYAAKMAVEVDFHVIKSVTQLRPVRHQTNAKVRAHVDLCMLALAIERALDAALPDQISASMAFEELETVRLIDVAPDAKSRPRQTLTRATSAQREILREMDMLSLLELPM